jgi:hypothetical protein
MIAKILAIISILMGSLILQGCSLWLASVVKDRI